MRKTRGATRTGFTLIEVMMAAAILVVGFIGLIQAITIGTEALDTSRKQQIASQIMDAEIERLRASSWATITAVQSSGTINISTAGAVTGDTNRFGLSSDPPLAALAKGFTCSFTRTWLRPNFATAATVSYLKIVYTVTWTSNTGRTYSRSTEAYFGENGLHLSNQKS